MDAIITSIVIGIGATVLFDLWALARSRLFGMPFPNWRYPGRWFVWLFRGRFIHDLGITATPPRTGELPIGWLFHYGVGILWGALTVIIGGPGWIEAPTLWPALLVGVVTVLAGWLILSPGMGAGIANSRAPNRWEFRIHSLIAHVIFGLGLWLTALALA